MLEHHVIAGIGNELSGLPLSVGGPEGSFPAIAAAARIEKIGIRRYQPGELGLRAVMIDAEAILPLGAIRQAAIHTLGRELAPEKGFVRGIGRVGRGIELPAVTGLGIAKGIQRHYSIPNRRRRSISDGCARFRWCRCRPSIGW